MKSGETLVTIARKLRVNRVDLAEANYLTTRSRVRAGQKLIVPRPPATLMAGTARTPHARHRIAPRRRARRARVERQHRR